MNEREKVTMHFDLSHCPQHVEFTLLAGDGKQYVLTAYKDAPDKMQAHQAQNKALALIPPDKLHHITHFVEDAELYATGVSIRRVVFPSLDDHPLPEIAMAFIHVGSRHVKQYIRQNPAGAGKATHPMALAHYGVSPEAVHPDEADAIRLHAADIKPPGVTAQTLVCSHPEIGSVNPAVTQHVLETYANSHVSVSFSDLVQFIQNNGAGTDNQWYNKSWVQWSKNPNGDLDQGMEPVAPDPDIVYKDRGKAAWPLNPDTGQPGIPTYELTDEFDPPAKTGSQTETVSAHATAAVHEILRKTKDDQQLNGHLWNTQQGKTQKVSPEATPATLLRANGSVPDVRPTVMAAADSSAAKGFALKNITSQYGLYLYDDELIWDSKTKFLSFPVKNWPNRYLSVYVQFFRQDGTAIERKDIKAPNPVGGSDLTWNDNMPEFLHSAFEANATKNYLTWLSAGTTVFGAPVPPLTQKTDLSFLWPQEATKADVLLGGLGFAQGFRDWDTDVDLIGVLGTSIVCYGVSFISMGLQVKVINPFIASLKGDVAIAFYIVAGLVGAVATAVGGAAYQTGWGKMILSKMAGIAAGVIFGQITKRAIPAAAKLFIQKFFGLTAEFMAEISAEEAVEIVPVAGWALKIAAVASDLADMTATTIESGLSPATYKLEVLHTMDLTVTVKPDPAHGKPGFKPVWPLVSDHYVIQVQYPKGKYQEGGTTFTKAGPMPGQTDEPIVVTFQGIPAGGKIEVIAGIYSESNWLAGQWNSGWVNAAPDTNDQQAIGGSIKESLVPLTATTTYSEKRTLVYDDKQRHHWQATKFSMVAELAAELDKGGEPAATVQAAFSDNGVALAANSTITVNTAGQDWTLGDHDAGVSYHIYTKDISSDPTQPLRELEVQNATNPGPPLPAHWPLSGGSGNNHVAALQNITYNNKQYALGYAWQASGQNLPRDNNSAPDNDQMYTMQSISTLGQPQDQITQPTRGFTNPSFIAYNQFGLTPLFPLDIAVAPKLQNGVITADIASQFAGFGYALPSTAEIRGLADRNHWLIGVAGSDPLYDLRVVASDDSQASAKSGAPKQAIGVFSWPVPALDNFYLDSRSYTPENKLYYLRGIQLDTPPGEYTFDYDTAKAWGAFKDITIQDMVVHPHGYVIAVDFQNHKLLTLKLPADACDEASAPFAMPLSGEGLRDGLMRNPQALTVTADGRILVLEQGNKRIQAFDTRGNPVPSFSVNQPSFQIDQTYISTLDSRTASTALVQEFQKNTSPALAPLFSLPNDQEQSAVTSIVNDLNGGHVDEMLLQDLRDHGLANTIYTTADFTVTQTVTNQLWLVTDQKAQSVYDIRAKPNAIGATDLFVYRAYTLAITLRAAGKDWLVSDTTNAMTFEITKPSTSNALTVQQIVSVMPLRDQDTPGITYLDLAVETKGYIYVLSVQEDGDNPPVFSLDIHEPNGMILLEKQQAGVNANKLAIDQWRSMFTLNFNTILGSGQRTEPGISQWEPSTPPGDKPGK